MLSIRPRLFVRWVLAGDLRSLSCLRRELGITQRTASESAQVAAALTALRRQTVQ